ncbi:unnamed protein product [Amoebophrya sp. A25]|nr:unnamed protein product [Amoebophrya sp. A25]|eukprot:GSA25T00007550001.1
MPVPRLVPPGRSCDSRDLKAGSVVSDLNGYYDSQNIISIFDERLARSVLSCVLHHSDNREGGAGLTLSHTRSTNGGKIWSPLIPVETYPPQSHDGYQLRVGSRIYLFYGCNRGSQPAGGPQISRTDMQLDEGFWMKWSDDAGRSFSGDRVCIPIPRTEIDRCNPCAPTIGAFCCDKPQLIDGTLFFAFQKTRDGNGESYGSEVFVVRSRNFLEKHKTEKLFEIEFEVFPRGTVSGLQTPRGLLLGEEPHIMQISGAKMLLVWRTELGFLDSCVSFDYGENWVRDDPTIGTKNLSPLPTPLLYEPPPSSSTSSTACGSDVDVSLLNDTKLNAALLSDKRLNGLTPAGGGEQFMRNREEYLTSREHAAFVADNPWIMRHPRGAFTPFRLANGHYVLLYYNNGRTERVGYTCRLIYWLSVGKIVRKGELGSSATSSGNITTVTDSANAACQSDHLLRAPCESDQRYIRWSQPEIVLFWDGVCFDDSTREWSEEYAIVDGPGYADFQEDVETGELIVVESNKLTVRFHRVDTYLVESMKLQLVEQPKVDKVQQDEVNEEKKNEKETLRMRERLIRDSLVQSYESGAQLTSSSSSTLRCPVLADLRSGGGFTIRVVLDQFDPKAMLTGNANSEDAPRTMLVNGLTTASSALDEPAEDVVACDSPTIQKGYTIELGANGDLIFSLTDGFKIQFSMTLSAKSLVASPAQTAYYQLASAPTGPPLTSFCFVCDGGPKVATCVINDRLYNAAPCGWFSLPREFGEIGGADVEVVSSNVKGLQIFDRALSTSECIALFRETVVPY